ncbi:MAG TPA: V-type ATPase 116kDa subunit family protein [Pilimelia sp.]|nr:V-type ATPase 116kDa subunit family protein [Pilimelia sp.]
MAWRDAVMPLPMIRVAVVTPEWAMRDTLRHVADAGVMEIDRVVAESDLPPSAPARALTRLKPDGPVVPRLAAEAPDLEALVRAGRADLLAGEAELIHYAAQAVRDDDVGALVGWTPAPAFADLSKRLTPLGAAVVPLPRPRGVTPPTAERPGRTRQAFAPLVRTYATVPYADVDPTVVAGLAYVVMFGAMFGDAGHGALLLLAGLLIRAGRPRRLAGLRPHWLFVAAAGLASMLFGLAYGEFFGPTGVVPVLWLAPMEHPVPLLLAGVGLGVVLLAGAYAIGTVNRVREGGWRLALYAPSGIAGALLFLAAGLGVAAWYLSKSWLAGAAGALAAVGLALAYAGLVARAGGGGAGVLQAAIELLDVVIRLGTNVVSFARLAAFGLTHAVLGWIVWTATTGLAGNGIAAAVAAVGVFVVGNAVSFGLEALVAGVQALRLEYYELFSRVFQSEGRPFQPWHVAVEEESCPRG